MKSKLLIRICTVNPWFLKTSIGLKNSQLTKKVVGAEAMIFRFCPVLAFFKQNNALKSKIIG